MNDLEIRAAIEAGYKTALSSLSMTVSGTSGANGIAKTVGDQDLDGRDTFNGVGFSAYWSAGNWIIQSATYNAVKASAALTPAGLVGWTVTQGNGQPVVLASGVPPTEYENVAFESKDLPLWTSFILLPTQPTVATFGDNGEDEERAIVQIDINILRNTGEKPLFQVLSKLQNFFTAGRVLSYNQGTATIISCGASPGREVDSWFRRSVTIYFYARTTRPTIS